ncbi:dihydroorotate dehydrogenase, partial [bacterium]|nr:dihydroorotate dehydrogenase [bacterium]
PIIAKLTPNVTDVSVIAQAAAEAGADAVSLVNTFMGLAIDWKKKRFVLGNGTGGLSGPAIKPIALRIVWQVAKKVKIPIIGIGGIASVDDVMEFILAGASAVQLGTVNFYDPTAAQRIVSEIPAALKLLNLDSVSSAVGLLAR